MEYRHYEIVIKETGSPLPLTTAYVGFTDPAGLTAFFGLEEDDVEWYVIEEILSRTGMKTIRRIRWRNHNRYSNMNKKKNTEMTEKYLAIEIHGEIFVMNDNDGLGGLTDNDVPHTVIGQVCTDECNTTCLHYRQGPCPCKTMKDTFGEVIHAFV